MVMSWFCLENDIIPRYFCNWIGIYLYKMEIKCKLIDDIKSADIHYMKTTIIFWVWLTFLSLNVFKEPLQMLCIVMHCIVMQDPYMTMNNTKPKRNMF